MNREKNDNHDGIALISIIVSMFENMHGRLENELPLLVSLLLDQLNHQQTLPEEDRQDPFTSMLLQAIAMSFAYNSRLVFEYLNSSNTIL